MRDKIDEYLIKSKQIDHEPNADPTDEELLLPALEESVARLHESHRPCVQRKNVNTFLCKDIPKEDMNCPEESPEMIEFLYGQITLGVFNRIKKLKSLAQSTNEEEATVAHQKAMQMCEEYGLEYDRIPCYIDLNKKN
jgi:hypothetical protein